MVAVERSDSQQALIPERLNHEAFLDVIGRSDLKEKITPQTPIVSVSMEIDVSGGAFAGGLGILEGDKWLQAAKTRLPYVALTVFPPDRWRQNLDIFWPKQEPYKVHPEEVGFIREPQSISIRANGDEPILDTYVYREMNAAIVATHESGLGGLYASPTDSDHRLFQEAVLGFGGYKAIKMLGLRPSLVLVNESPAVFYPVAEFDDLCKQGMSPEDALLVVRAKTAYLNHTLEQGAEGEFHWDKFERYIFRNMQSQEARKWVSDIIYFHGGGLRLSTLALAFSGKHAGVSVLHAQKASRAFVDHERKQVRFDSITNGIFVDRWAHGGFKNMDIAAGVVDKNDLPTDDYAEKIAALDSEQQRRVKDQARAEMRNYLKTRIDQNAQPIDIPESEKVVVWAKRFVNYKRPDMMFDDPNRLAAILEENNMHMVLSSKIVEDPNKFLSILQTINSHSTLRQRVHYVQNYDPELARHLVAGADVWLNTPVVGKEACGTSIFKAIKNRTIVISTNDGGIADVQPAPCLVIEGNSYKEEVNSLYEQIQRSADIIDGEDVNVTWDEFVKQQLAGYLPIISGSRMLRDYINCGFPKEEIKKEPKKTLLLQIA